jgi:hypothetical protein
VGAAGPGMRGRADCLVGVSADEMLAEVT